MRLIDADALILHLNDYALTESPNDNETTEERRTSEMVYRVIQNCIKAVEEQPTAYDPKAVVAELEEKALEHDIYGRKYSADRNVNSALNEFDKRDAYYKAIEIVRKGGV